MALACLLLVNCYNCMFIDSISGNWESLDLAQVCYYSTRSSSGCNQWPSIGGGRDSMGLRVKVTCARSAGNHLAAGKTITAKQCTFEGRAGIAQPAGVSERPGEPPPTSSATKKDHTLTHTSAAIRQSAAIVGLTTPPYELARGALLIVAGGGREDFTAARLEAPPHSHGQHPMRLDSRSNSDHIARPGPEGERDRERAGRAESGR